MKNIIPKLTRIKIYMNKPQKKGLQISVEIQFIIVQR